MHLSSSLKLQALTGACFLSPTHHPLGRAVHFIWKRGWLTLEPSPLYWVNWESINKLLLGVLGILVPHFGENILTQLSLEMEGMVPHTSCLLLGMRTKRVLDTRKWNRFIKLSCLTCHLKKGEEQTTGEDWKHWVGCKGETHMLKPLMVL